MDKPKTQTIKPPLLINEQIFYSPAVVISEKEIIEAIEKSSLDSFSKSRLLNLLQDISVKDAIEVLVLLKAAKELFCNAPDNYNIIVNVINVAVTTQQQINF